MQGSFRKILIIILIIGVLIFVYAWYSSRSETKTFETIAPVAGQATAEKTASSGSSQIPQAQEIIRIISLLNKISLDVGFFSSKAFKSLDDFSVQLPSLESGRSNPFAPLE